jgi:type II secretory pathway component PulF
MSLFKYQAVLPQGVSVFGTFEADDVDGLAAYLQSRNLTLVDCTELSVHNGLTGVSEDLPRMVQLRIGERLREALLTGIPAHLAVRAMASEPLEHPLLLIMPWLMLTSVCTGLGIGLLAVVPAEPRVGLLGLAIGLPIVCAATWWLMRDRLVQRPLTALRRIADQLESGEAADLSRLGALPVELQAVVDSRLSSQSKAISVAELVPMLMGLRLKTHQFAARIVGPLMMACLLFGSLHLLLLYIVPSFREIFAGFGVELPGLTVLVIGASNLTTLFGVGGFLAISAIMAAILVGLYLMLTWSRMTELVEAVPWLGLSVRWLMQARVTRVLGVLIRNETPSGEALRVASAASGFPEVAIEGESIAMDLEKGRSGTRSGRLSGVPLALLQRLDGQTDLAERQVANQAFQNYAAALENAASGNGKLFVFLIEVASILVAAMAVGLLLISMFLPLIKLLNDLSCILPPSLRVFGGPV